jgi:hypothetical protein
MAERQIAEEKRLDPAAYTQTVPAASLSPLPPAGTPAPALATTDPFVVGSEWSGISLTPYDCELHVKSVNGNKWEGTMLWPTLGPTCTKVEGEIGPGPDEVKWMEVDYVDGDDVELKSEYVLLLIMAFLSPSIFPSSPPPSSQTTLQVHGKSVWEHALRDFCGHTQSTREIQLRCCESHLSATCRCVSRECK